MAVSRVGGLLLQSGVDGGEIDTEFTFAGWGLLGTVQRAEERQLKRRCCPSLFIARCTLKGVRHVTHVRIGTGNERVHCRGKELQCGTAGGLHLQYAT